jgi:hypothetical protein
MIDREADTAVARWASRAPSVDDFDDPEWTKVDPVHLTRYWSGQEAPATRHAQARARWSNEALHVLFDCRQHEPLIAANDPQTKQKTIGLWDRDVCEIFIAPDSSNPETYYEFEAAPTGEWLDVAITFDGDERKSDWTFLSGITVASRRAEDRLLIGMRIPWTTRIPKPARSERWRANFLRCIGSGDDRGYLAWQPTMTPEPNFHVPSVFGWLLFE